MLRSYEALRRVDCRLGICSPKLFQLRSTPSVEEWPVGPPLGRSPNATARPGHSGSKENRL